ncbi:MAG: hypothetical protein BAJATHORv1_70052 [Candidatus Thorarchaeota archaeon]|nr:MAG: hypothetical protein BAJATHORv1_70052 [Candidatus Thorarchaeota archaeon]
MGGPSLNLTIPVKNERIKQIALNHRINVNDIEESEEGFESLRGLLNAVVYSKAEGWMKPYWVEKRMRQKDSTDSLSNDMDRYWALVGSPGGKGFGVVDIKGLVTANPNCGSIDFFIRDDDKIVFPALEDDDITLISSSDQIYQWDKQVGPVQYTRYIYHTTKGNKEAVVNEIHLQNLSMKKITCTFYIALRPMSVQGVEPLSSTHYNEEERALYGNRELAVIARSPPTAVIMQSGDNPNLISELVERTEGMDCELSAGLGLATAVLRYDVTLKPSRSGTFYFFSPLVPIAQGDSVPSYPEYESMRDSTIASWYSFSEETSYGSFPDRELDEAFSQAKANLTIQARSLLLPDDDEFQLSWHECARVLVALNRIGNLGLAKDISLRLSRMIKPSAEKLDEQLVPLIWSILEHYKCTKDKTYLKLMRPFLNKVYPLIIEQIKRDLELESQTGEKKIWTEEEVISMLWRYASLHSGAISYAALEDEKQTADISSLLDKYEILLINAFHEMKIASDESLIDIIGTAALLGLTDLDVAKMNDILDLISSRVITKGLVKTQHKYLFSSHLALRVAHYYVVERQNYAVERLLKRTLRYLTPFNLLAEYVSSQTQGGAKGDGCSLIASVDFLLLLREMVIFSAREILAILPGAPDSWHESTSPMIMSRIQTASGEIQVEMGVSSNQNQIEILMKEHLPKELVVYVPTYYNLHMIKVFGGAPLERAGDESCAFVRLVPLSNNVVITYRRQ